MLFYTTILMIIKYFGKRGGGGGEVRSNVNNYHSFTTDIQVLYLYLNHPILSL